MMGNLSGVALSTTAASGRTFAPSARRDGVDDQHRDACRRVSFVRSRLHPIIGESIGIGAEAVTAMQVEVKDVSGKLAIKRLFHLARSDALGVTRCGDTMRMNRDVNIGSAFASSGSPDFSCLVIGLCHFEPPVSLLI